jgi:flagellum-specific peptidoglycan hydrolase FlgJ
MAAPAQPVRHQGRARVDAGRWPRSRPPSTSTASRSKVTARFRAYNSYAESFADYARLIKNSPRYADVVARGGDATGFAQGLQRAGYATDPAYADKLSRVINTTLRLQRSLT